MSKPAAVRWWWLSFRDPVKNEWLGGCWIDGVTADDAIRVSHARGLNPGGEIVVSELNGGPPPPEELGRLLQKGDLELARLGDIA